MNEADTHVLVPLPFQTRLTHFQLPQGPCSLPFVLGSATQHRPSAVTECENSQDAVALNIASHCMVAVIADGCSGTHPTLETSSRSSNEVGAKLLAFLVANTAQRIALGDSRLADARFLERMNQEIRTALHTLVEGLCGADAARRSLFIHDFLMATVLGLIVTESRYLVFYSGDGIIAINDEIAVLDGCEGQYLANELIGHRDAAACLNGNFALFGCGNASELRSILLATDGFVPLASKYPEKVRALMSTEPRAQQIENGVDYLLQEFRQKVVWNLDSSLRLEDDATFALLRRFRTENNL